MIITYGDGLIEALKVSKLLEDVIPISVVCLTSFVGAREVPNSLVTFLDKAKYFVGIDTSNLRAVCYNVLLAICLVKLIQNLDIFTAISLVLRPQNLWRTIIRELRRLQA